MNRPELLASVMIRELEKKAAEEEKTADELYTKMHIAGSGPTAKYLSDEMKKHRYAAQEFRKMVKIMKEKQ